MNSFIWKPLTACPLIAKPSPIYAAVTAPWKLKVSIKGKRFGSLRLPNSRRERPGHDPFQRACHYLFYGEAPTSNDTFISKDHLPEEATQNRLDWSRVRPSLTLGWLFQLLLSERQGTLSKLIAGPSYKDEQPFTPKVSPQTWREHTNPTSKIPLAPKGSGPPSSHWCDYIPCKNHKLTTPSSKVLILFLWQKWTCHKPLKANSSGAKGKKIKCCWVNLTSIGKCQCRMT